MILQFQFLCGSEKCFCFLCFNYALFFPQTFLFGQVNICRYDNVSIIEIFSSSKKKNLNHLNRR